MLATIPQLTRSSLHRCLARHGIGRLPEVEGDKPRRKKFDPYPIGFFHIDLAEGRTAQGKLSLFVAIDRTSKFAVVELVERADRRAAAAFLEAPIEAVPYRTTADIFGREAGLFLPSGSMGNLIAVKLHTQAGQEVICEAQSHVVDWEMGMMGAFAGCMPRPVTGEKGILTWDKIRLAVAPKVYYRAQTGLSGSRTHTTWRAARSLLLMCSRKYGLGQES